MDIGDEVLDYSESDGEDEGKEESTLARHNDSEEQSTPFESGVPSGAAPAGYAPTTSSRLQVISEEDEPENDEQELDYEEDETHESMIASQGAADYPLLSSDDEEHGVKDAHSPVWEEEGSVPFEGEEEDNQVEGEEGSQVEREEEGSSVEGEEEGSQVEGAEGSQVEGEEGSQVEGEEEGSQVEGEEGSQVEGEGKGSLVEGEEEDSHVEGEKEEVLGSEVEGEDMGSQVEGEEGGQVEGEEELGFGVEKVEQNEEQDIANSSSPASVQPPVEPLSPSVEGDVGGPSDLFGSSDEEDSSISKPKRPRLESDSDGDVGANLPEVEEVDTQEMSEVEKVGTQEVPEVEEVGTQEVVEQGDEDYVGSASEEGEGGGSDEELAAELDALTEGEGHVSGKVDVEEEEEEEDDQQLAESSEGKPLVYDFDLMMEKRRAQQRRSRKRKRDINDLTVDDDIVEDLIGKMRHAAEEDRKLNLAQRAATKKLALLPVLVESLKKSDVVMRFIDAGGLEVISDWLTPLPDHSLPNQKIRETLLENLRNFPAVDNYTLKKSRIGKAVMLLYRHPKEIRKNKEKAGKLIQEWARPIFGLTSDFKSLSRDEREQRDYAHLTPSVRRRLSSGEEGQRKTGLEIDDALKPGDQGWIGRARVPMPSNKDYVVRPKWNVEAESKKSRKKTMSRYDKQVQKWRDTKKSKGATHAAKLSIAGNKMAI